MATLRAPLADSSKGEEGGIHALSVQGFKSIDEEQSIELRPLTILAGANSSGKSSVMQPLLLLKQTLEAPYDPGPLLLNGPNVKFTSVSQLVCRPQREGRNGFTFGIRTNPHSHYKLHFAKGIEQPVELISLTVEQDETPEVYRAGEVPFAETPLKDRFARQFGRSWAQISQNRALGPPPRDVTVIRDRCFLTGEADFGMMGSFSIPIVPLNLGESITRLIHVPGHRGNPRRNYPVTAVGDQFPGTFEEYVASVIAAAQRKRDHAFLDQLGADLREIGLTWKVQARSVDDTQVELRVGRLAHPTNSGDDDLVSIADVGFGVSQTLPVVVALLVARPGQLVYIEQPEIHLHPRAQHAMAALLARAAARGVRVVIETHSSLLLLGIQRLVATDQLDPEKVKLHWFRRDPQTGMTNITSADLDGAGAFGAWPEDFDDVTLAAQQQYLDAAEKKLAP